MSWRWPCRCRPRWTRVGTGYIQTLTSAGGSGITWVVAKSDGSTAAYILTGSIYTDYLALGGFTGSLGYPVSDPLPGPGQKFASGAALAGSPVTVVAAQVANKWFSLGGVAAGAGQPMGTAASFESYSGAMGVTEAFANGQIFGISTGVVSGLNLAGQAFYSNGLILARYLALSGPTGAGIPISDVSRPARRCWRISKAATSTCNPARRRPWSITIPALPR